MRLEWAFRVSGYLTLALASLTLGLAASPFMPGLSLLAIPLLLVLALAFCLEGRVALPAWAANVFGVGIALGGMVWMGWQLYGRIHESGLEDVPMPAALLPFLGPLLIVLMLVKLLRPKQAVDHWTLQGLGLMLVTLTCVMGSEPVLGILLLAYLACGLWHLAIFHVHREAAAAPDAKKKPLATHRVAIVRSIARAVLWTGAALVIGLPLFLLLPRQGQSAWNPYQMFGGAKPAGGPRTLQTGFNNEIDLNRTGEVEINDEIALTVQVEDNEGRPKLDLNADQRWRGAVLEYYDDGRWLASAPIRKQTPTGGAEGDRGNPLLPQDTMPQGPPPPRTIGLAASGRKLPDLGPDQFYLTFAFQARTAGGLFLAEPVLSHSDPQDALDSIPVVSLGGEAAQAPLFQELRQTLQPGVKLGRGEYSYRQVTRPPAEPGLGESVDHLKAGFDHLRVPRIAAGRVGEWTEQLLDRLEGNSALGLSKGDLPRDEHGTQIFPVPQDKAEKVAVALTEYLAHSGDYTYTLDRRRHDTSIDPTLDFLLNVKQGHCERFAGALALMLRSRGIHARVVTGFRGAEGQGDGSYVIRQNFAHSWVETLVQRKGPDGIGHWHWRMLDPTPSTEAPPPSPFSWARWWENHRDKSEVMWRDLIVNYETEQQYALLRDTWDWLVKDSAKEVGAGPSFSWRSFAFLALAAAVAVPAFRLAFRLWPRPRLRVAARSCDVPFYNRLLALLAQHTQLRPKPTQTPREFAESARHVLAAAPSTASLAGIPVYLAALLYRVRYGNRPLNAEESRSTVQDLERLAAGLAR